MSNRSGSAYSVPRDANRVPFLVAASTADGITPVVLEADPNTHLLQVTTGGASLPSTLVSFLTTIATAGVRVQLGSNALTQGVVVQAPSTNTGVIYVGGSTVSSSVYGAELQPGQSTGIAVNNTNLIWADTATNGNKIVVIGS